MNTPDDPTAPETPDVDPAALAELHTLFAELPPEDMPDDVTDRVMAALQQAQEPPSIEEYRRRRRTRRILASAAALVIIAGGIFGLIQVTGSPSPSINSATSEGMAQTARPGFAGPFDSNAHAGQATSTLPDFTAADLPGEVAALIANPVQSTDGEAGVAACVASGFQSGATPIAARQGRYGGRSALLLLYQDPKNPDRVNAFVVALPCSASGTTTLWHESVTR